MESPDQDLTGVSVGNYRIVKTLGHGGTGQVLLAEDLKLPRKVAIKILRPPYAKNRELLRRFSREAQTVSALNHPHIISIIDIGEDKIGKYIVMEYVDGATLRQRVTGVGFAQMLEWAVQIARALHAAHVAGIVHRDIKPENILIRDDGYVKVVDFGLARRSWPQANSPTPPPTQQDTELQTTVDGLLGTIKYMSPEQALRRRTITTSTDIFSFGIVLYEMFTGIHPFAGQTIAATLHAIISQEPIRPQQFKPSLDPWLDTLIVNMLAKDPTVRPSANEVVKQLASDTHDSLEIRIPASPVRPFVGRKAEQAALRDAIKAIERQGGLLLCFAGEPGIGKTTLVEEFLQELELSGKSHLVGRGRCSERLAESEAYLPFLEALDDLLRTDGDGKVKRTLKSLALTWYQGISHSIAETGERAISQERMKRELIAFLQELTRHHSLVLFFDDLHWADDSTIDMLAYISRPLQSIRMLIIATYRPTEMHLSQHPFLALKLDLMGRNLCKELQVEYLTVADIDRYAGMVFSAHAFPEDFARVIHERTEGNALFMSDLLHYLKSREVIRKEGESWVITKPLSEVERNLPESVRSIVQRKIGQLEEEDRRLLTAASIQGFDFDSASVARVVQIDPADVEERLDRLERIHSVVRMVEEKQFPDGTLTLHYQFVHVLYQNALYASILPTRKRQLSRKMAEALEGFYRDRSSDIASNLAFLFEISHDFGQAASYLILAVRNALNVFAYKQAAALSQHALKLLQMLPPSDERTRKEFQAHMFLGSALVTLTGGSSTPEVEEAYSRALELAESLHDDDCVFTGLYGLWMVYILRADYDRTLEVAKRLFPLAERAQDPSLLVIAYSALGYVKPLVGDFAGAVKDLEEVFRRQTPGMQATGFARFNVEPKTGSTASAAVAYWALGFPDKAQRLMREAREATKQVKHPVTVAGVMTWSAGLALDIEDYPAAKQLAEEALAYAKSHGIVQSIGHSRLCYGAALAALGDIKNGVAEIRSAIQIHDSIGCALGRSLMLLTIAEALGATGDLPQATATLGQARAFAKQTNELYRAPEFDRIQANLLLLSLGRLELLHTTDEEKRIIEASESHFRASLEIARAHQARSFELKTALDFSRLLQMQGKVAQGREVVDSVLSGFTEGFDTPMLARAHRALSTLQNS